MTIEYKTLTENEKDDIIVSFLHQQELDHLCHTINKERYENIINDKSLPNTEFKQRIQELRDEIEVRLFEVEKIIEHTKEQLPDQERIASSVNRILNKNKIENNRK